jgi:hypothetical protein
MVKAYIMTHFKDINIKEIGKKMFLLEKVNKNFQMDLIIKDNLVKEQKVDMGIMFAILVYMKDSF